MHRCNATRHDIIFLWLKNEKQNENKRKKKKKKRKKWTKRKSEQRTFKNQYLFASTDYTSSTNTHTQMHKRKEQHEIESNGLKRNPCATHSTTNMEAKRTRIVHGKPVFGQNARISLATFVWYQCILTFCTTGIRMNVWFTNRLVILKNKVALDHKNQDFIMPLSIVLVEREFHFNWTDVCTS